MDKLILKKAKTQSMVLEAVLRSCKLVADRRIVCKHAFHRGKLVELKEEVERVFGGPLILFETVEDFKSFVVEDALIAIAVNELGAEIIC